MSPAMPTSTASSFAEPLVRTQTSSATRDARLDFFRGLALLMIFIDHVSGNGLAAYTLQGLGFADAAEIFVFIAGLAGVYAYRRSLLEKGLAAGSAPVLARIGQLYLAHLLMVGGMLIFAMAVLLSGSGFDAIGKLGLQPLLDDPAAAITRLPVMAYLPHYLDILPLYIVLFAALPLVVLGFRLHLLLPLGAALACYGGAMFFGLNLPNLGQPDGWFLNPFTWALVFVLGATTAEMTLRGLWAQTPRLLVAGITALAAAYVIFAFLYASPWRTEPLLQGWIVLETSKTWLSWHRLLDILAKVWLVAVLVPRGASFLSSGAGEAISRAGRHSLPVFVVGAYLSLAASVLLHETGGGLEWQVIVNVGGVAILLGLAILLDGRKRRNKAPAPLAAPPSALRRGDQRRAVIISARRSPTQTCIASVMWRLSAIRHGLHRHLLGLGQRLHHREATEVIDATRASRTASSISACIGSASGSAVTAGAYWRSRSTTGTPRSARTFSPSRISSRRPSMPR